MNPETVSIHRAPLQAPWAHCVVVRQVTRASPDEPLRAVVHANPYASINVVVQGSVRAGGASLPAAFLTGPLAIPIATVVECRLVSATLVLQPWVLEPLFSVSPEALAGLWVDAQSLPSPRLRAWCKALGEIASQQDRVGAFWSESATDARSCAAPELAVRTLVLEGVESAAAQCGCTSRHYRRRFRRHMGLGPAAWLKLARWEQATTPVLAHGPGSASLAQVALATGYSDQAHLTRTTRSIAQTSPNLLRDASWLGQLPWPLRPADVRSVQDVRNLPNLGG